MTSPLPVPVPGRPSPRTRIAYLGCRTTRERQAQGEGLSVLAQDADGGLQPLQLLRGLVNPSYLLLNRAGSRLYAVHGDGHEVSAFAVDGASGRLRPLGTRSTQGRNPVHLALTPDETALVVVNHLGASLAWLPLRDDGALAPLQALWPLDGPIGPHRSEQTQPKPHFIAWTPDGRHLLVPDKGCDRIHVRRWRGDPTCLADAAVEPAALLREGSGPRHLAHLPHGPWTVVLNELDSTLVRFARVPTADGGLRLQPLQCLSTLPDDFMGHSRAAAIAVAADGRRLYTSNRGHDSISVFDVEVTDGGLRRVQVQASGGRTPRAFSLSPCGRWLYALHEDSHGISRLAVDPHDGRLGPAQPVLATGSPTCLVFAPAP
ncbi:lactonase family protein [Pseudaquabacterium rugosum]|uniref:Lactonase family protein n=1 Tax=Pseudaquabacterium rugosum TaxID=2984194 RepID=A0ABU9B7V0_9BURK